MDFIRLGGIAGLVALVIVVTINFIIVEPTPSPDTPIAEVASYLTSEAEMLEVGNGLRYSAFALLTLFATGLYQFVRGDQDSHACRWATAGLLGPLWILAVGSVANSIVAVAVWRVDSLASQSQLLTMLWSVANALFIAAMVPWAVLILGFSLAGRLTGVLPTWVTGLGILATVLGMLTELGLVSVLTGG